MLPTLPRLLKDAPKSSLQVQNHHALYALNMTVVKHGTNTTLPICRLIPRFVFHKSIQCPPTPQI